MLVTKPEYVKYAPKAFELKPYQREALAATMRRLAYPVRSARPAGKTIQTLRVLAAMGRDSVFVSPASPRADDDDACRVLRSIAAMHEFHRKGLVFAADPSQMASGFTYWRWQVSPAFTAERKRLNRAKKARRTRTGRK